jgi:glycerate-2-kinase
VNRQQESELLTSVFTAAVSTADPFRVTQEAVAGLSNLAPSAWVIAVGKGSAAMARGAVQALEKRRVVLSGGIVVAQARPSDPVEPLEFAIGDHPVPSDQSFAAASQLGRLLTRVPSSDDAIVLVSGGATSLIAAPVPPIPDPDIAQLFKTLLASGADIELMNALRKRVLRWGAGRLAVALRARRIHCLVASDVIGNDPAFIASGPCVPDSLTSRDVLASAAVAGLLPSLPDAVRDYINDVAAGRGEETPKPDHPRFASTTTTVILDRGHAIRGAVEALRDAGIVAEVHSEPLTGRASLAGTHVVDAALSLANHVAAVPRCVVYSGETTVQLGARHGRGGRCQELALSAARALHEAGESARGITVLAAGTDGRDGPTEAAGAIVDATTWSRAEAAGVDADAALRDHDSNPALDAAGALLRTGPTGTNVNDLVLVLLSARG